MDGENSPPAEKTGRMICPHCGERVLMVSMIGPTEQIAGPCGCRFPPGLLE